MSGPESGPMEFWAEMARAGPEEVAVAGVALRAGSRVRLRPRAGRDAFDLVLAGRIGVVEGLDQDDEGRIHLAVTLEDDPGRDLGAARFLGHRFFFAPDEVEPLETTDAQRAAMPRILVAGIGNIFFGDDAFGVAVAQRLAGRVWPPGVEVVDFGIRGMDLAYALQRGYAAAILVDAVPGGEPPGTLSVLEPALDTAAGEAGGVAIETHAMDPVRVLRLAHGLGGLPPRVLVVGCEPQSVAAAGAGAALFALSPAVEAALEGAVELVTSLVASLRAAAETNAPEPDPPEPERR